MHSPHHPPRPRAPLGLLAAVALAALLLIGGVSAWLAWQWYILDATLPTVATALRVALLSSPFVAGGVGLAIAWRRWATIELLKADRVVALTKAQQQRFPEHLQSLSFHDSSKPTVAPVPAPLTLPVPEPPSVPTFAQLLDQGKIGPNRPLLLGFDVATGQAIEGTWEDLYSCGIGGLQGSGKTWAAVYLLCQSALQGGRLVICDPHASDEQSLAARIAPLQSALLCNIADDDKTILSALKMADDKLQRRKHGHKARWPIVVAVDEFLSLRRGPLAALLPPLIEDFSTEGRKLNCHVLLLSQRWKQDAIGDFRNTLASNYVYRMRRQEAAMMTGLPADGGLPGDTLSLSPGECYLLDTRGTCRKIIVPLMTPADVVRVGGMLDQVNRPPQPFGFHSASGPLPTITAEAPGKPLGSAVTGAASTATGSHESVSAEALRAAALFRQKMSEKAIIKELRGIEGGRGYDAARDEVRQLILEGLIHDHR